MGRGRPRKTDAQKMLEGNPGQRPLGGELQARGSPIRPLRLGKHESWLWSLVVQDWMGEIDTPELITLCETWGMLRRCASRARRDPHDRDTRMNYLAYMAEFNRLASRFGMTPSDRAKIRIPIDQDKGSDEDKYFGVVG